jgi:hypothetical protein
VIPAASVQNNGYDEVAAKRVEHQLGELGGRLAESLATTAWLEGALDEGTPAAELLRRIKALIADGQADLPRLMCEARKEIRGEG